MLFHSGAFVVFLAVVLAAYHALGHRGQNRMLLVASYVFYGWWDWRFLSLIAFSTLVDFACARAIARSSERRTRRRLLGVSLVSNLGVLGFFKYWDFFVESATDALDRLGWSVAPPILEIVLPVGISFYTFQTLGYTLDVYRGGQTPARRLDDFALYVAWFPQLVAGPIERSRTLLPQIERPRRVELDDWTTGLQLIVFGYFLKLVVADGVAPIVDRAFAEPGAQGGSGMALAVYLFALQIYGDFAGYTNIARGVSRLFGIRLMLNFRQPYLSKNVAEFWRRWHISLSTWLRDYLYIPLGGNRGGRVRTLRNLVITMLLGGLWHGASWNFVVWGGLHGLLLAVHRRLDPGRAPRRGQRPRRPRLPAWLRIVVTFHLVCALWIFFRAEDLESALAVFSALAGAWAAPSPDVALPALCFLATVGLLDALARGHPEALPVRPGWSGWQRGLLFGCLIAAISFIGDANVRPFIYFQF